MKSLDAQLLRFAGGELDGNEEAVFLARCEIEPARWRDACLALVEQRRVAAALRAFAAAGGAPDYPAGPRTKRRRWLPALTGVVGLAAGLLLAALATPARDVARTPAVAVEHADQAPVVPDAASVQPPADALADALNVEPLLSDVEQSALRDHGFQIEEQPELYFIEARDGTRWAVPVQRATLRFVQK